MYASHGILGEWLRAGFNGDAARPLSRCSGNAQWLETLLAVSPINDGGARFDAGRLPMLDCGPSAIGFCVSTPKARTV